MIRTEEMPVPQQKQQDDVELVAKSLNGSQDAFRVIVEQRYQKPDLLPGVLRHGQPEPERGPLAQETFVTAWKELPRLREPAKLRPWLCGILRFLVGKQRRRQGREPAHAAEPMEAMDELTHSPEPQPLEQAISNEELAVLWRSLEKDSRNLPRTAGVVLSRAPIHRGRGAKPGIEQGRGEAKVVARTKLIAR